MKIYLARHGESVSYGLDDERSLTEKGEQDMEKLAVFIKPLQIKVNHILHSQKYRAQQTAEILSSGFLSSPDMECSQKLDPLAAVMPIVDQIHAWDQDCLLVGHMPFMGRLVSLLVTGDENYNIVNFKPGCMINLDQIEQTRWAICWMLNPEILA